MAIPSIESRDSLPASPFMIELFNKKTTRYEQQHNEWEITPTLTYKEELVRRETIVSRIKDTIMANESFKSKSEFRISLNPTERHANQCTEYSERERERGRDWLDSIPSPTRARSHSSIRINLKPYINDDNKLIKISPHTSGYFSRAYFHPRIVSTKGLPPQSSLIASVNSKSITICLVVIEWW